MEGRSKAVPEGFVGIFLTVESAEALLAAAPAAVPHNLSEAQRELLSALMAAMKKGDE